MATSNAQRTRARGVIGVALAALFTGVPGCLPGEHRPEGRQVVPGRGVTGLPAVVRRGVGAMVLFETPDATLPHDGRWRNLHGIPLVGGAPRKLLDRALTWFPPVPLGPGLIGALTKPAGALAPVDLDADTPADRVLQVIDVETGMVPATLPGLVNLTLLRDGFAVLALSPTPGGASAAFPELTLGDALGATRTFGEVTGTSFARDGAAFFTRAKDDSLMRIDAQRRSLQLLANNVHRFEATRDGRFAIATGLAFDDPIRGIDVERAVSFPLSIPPGHCARMFRLDNGPTIVCIGGEAGRQVGTVVQLESRALVGRFSVVGDRAALVATQFTPDQSVMVLRYQNGKFMDLIGLATGTTWQLPAATEALTWNATGTHAAYEVRDVSELVPDGTMTSPTVSYPRLAVSAGTLLGSPVFVSPPRWAVGSFSFMEARVGEENILMWATLDSVRFALFVSPLPPLSGFAMSPVPPPPPSRLLASDVGRYVTGPGRVLALTSLSTQDHTGDLMFFDLETGTAKLLATDVFDFATAPPCPTCPALGPGTEVAFIVRTRRPLELEGLWVATLP